MEPKLATVIEEAGDQIGDMCMVQGQVKKMAQIEAHWASHHTLALADKEDGTNPNKKPIWKVLQVHPKAVALFLTNGGGRFEFVC